MIGGIQYSFNDCIAKIYPAGHYNDIDWSNENSPQLNFVEYKEKISLKPFIEIEKNENENFHIYLKETIRYYCKLEYKKQNSKYELPTLPNENNKLLKTEKDSDSIIFQFINYLGHSCLRFDESHILDFEVVPDKFDYKEDYIKLTEDIAEKCSNLLLEYSSPTSLDFKEEYEKQENTLLEQFIFLRQFCYSDNLQSLFEVIKRNPDRILVQEENFKLFGQGMPSKKFFTNPFTYGKNWQEVDGKYLPLEIAVNKKYESLNTAANRFIKFALLKFRTISEQLASKLNDNEYVECKIEAEKIISLIDDILYEPFFYDVDDLDILPQNNQVLQKREGYSQIFKAFSMIDLALQLDWKGKNEVYKGESKNVALLYEYWLFFELREIISQFAITKNNSETTFINNKNELIINLKEGEKSCQSFEIKDKPIKINLYYNRTFLHEDFSDTKYEGSYSRPFRPDYTISIFPSGMTEQEATQSGLVSFIHFDAKYRIEDLAAFIGSDNSNKTIDNELREEKADSISNTYKRGDLLKMHTYNDAIRRTVGSYVLYPGKLENKCYEIYDEILPGVGAFAIRPGIQNESENAIKQFIVQIVEYKCHNETRLFRKEYFENTIMEEPSIDTKLYQPTTAEYNYKQDFCALGYIRADKETDYYYFLEQNNFLELGKEFYFYYYAIKDGYVYSHHKEIAKAKYFKFYKNKISETKTYEIEPYIFEIISSELVSKSDLVKKLNEIGFSTNKNEHKADFYYITKVKCIDSNIQQESRQISEIDSINGNDTFSPHSPKII